MKILPIEFARIAHVSNSAVCQALQSGKIVKDESGRLDIEQPLNAAYLAKHMRRNREKEVAQKFAVAQASNPPNLTPTPSVRSAPKSAVVVDDTELGDSLGLPQQMLNLSLRELVKKYRGIDGIEKQIKMYRDLIAADEKEQRVHERRLQLIEKDFVIARLFRYIDLLMRQLLGFPQAIVDNIVAMVQSQGDAARMQVCAELESGISRIIRDAKVHIAKEIESLKSKYHEDTLETIRQVVEDAKDAV